jgi:hypothetical protein
LGGAAGFAAAGVSSSAEAASVFPERGFFRNGFVCLATLSHNARSSTLKLRLRRGDADHSGIEVGGGRFIGRGDND